MLLISLHHNKQQDEAGGACCPEVSDFLFVSFYQTQGPSHAYVEGSFQLWADNIIHPLL